LQEFSLNPALSSPEFIADFSSRYSAAANYSDPGGAFDLYGKPFVCARLRRLLASESALTSVASAAERLAYTRRSSDLHQLAQSGDLADAATRAPKILRQFRSFLLDSVRPWLQRLIGLQLSDVEIDVTCSRYGRGDCLLCHDDRMLGRRVAFVWYLVDSGWSDSDGGALELLGAQSGDGGPPEQVAASLLPERDSFVFFEVSRQSYHQVAEVTSIDKVRLSVHGWFRFPRGDPAAAALIAEDANAKEAAASPLAHLEAPLAIDEDLVYRWINCAYLAAETQAEIRSSFGDESQIRLDNFLNETLVAELIDQLAGATWTRVGPLTQRSYDVIALDDVIANDRAPLIIELDRLFRSDAMLVILSDLTGLSLHYASSAVADADEANGDEANGDKDNGDAGPAKRRRLDDAVAENSDRLPVGVCQGEFRRWRRGCYTLVRDSDYCGQGDGVGGFLLDAVWHCGCTGWRETMGGETHFTSTADTDGEPLVTVTPEDNCLNLVYRELDTVPFVKYLNANCAQLNSAGQFYDYRALYREPADSGK
uniref:uS12 prolyl 3-hydroxylase n=2 Tax=Macrostomum lignano TaxID=282301 RepID=A0A1I8I517_9PLAT